MARSPNVVSEMCCPVSTLIVLANTRTPSLRSTARLSSLPMVREPVQKSASPDTTGASTAAISAGLYWPSASVVTM
jgi:hypothetical protein